MPSFTKICDNCGELFDYEIIPIFKLTLDNNNSISCPVCKTIYFIVYNYLNEFTYLEPYWSLNKFVDLYSDEVLFELTKKRIKRQQKIKEKPKILI